ncbi:MAG: hypothetical protein ACI4FZ_04330, partial [Lachnospiraceae bacterium]
MGRGGESNKEVLLSQIKKEGERDAMKDESGKNNFLIAIISGVTSAFSGVLVEMILAPQNIWITVAVVLCAGISCFLVLYLLYNAKVISQKKKIMFGLFAAFLLGGAIATYIVGLLLEDNGDSVTGENLTASLAPTLADTLSPIPTPENTLAPKPTNTLTPEPTNTSTLKPTNTPTPEPTNTPTPKPTNTPTP